MDGQTGRARSPSGAGGYAQPSSGANMPSTTSSYPNAYETSISPTNTNPQFNYSDQSYMNNLNAPFQGNFQNQGEGGYMIDPSLQGASQPQQQSINPQALMGNASPSHSPAHSPSMQQQSGAFYSPNNHSRNASLNPSGAGAMPQQGQEWSGLLGQPSFGGHRRAPSEHSDIGSSLSPSPYPKQGGFDYDASHSPMLNPQQDSGIYPENLGIDRFTISDGQQPPQHISPRQSPYPSPRVSPQPGPGIPENNFVLPSNDGGRYAQQSYAGGDMQGSQMAPPEIKLDPAPPSATKFDMSRADMDGLTPPNRGRRIRALSDPSFPQVSISRPLGPGDTSPSLLAIDQNQRRRSLSPFDAGGSSSRDPSPSRGNNRRSSTPSAPNRDYILDLADPSRPGAPGEGGRQTRVQKHPATFQCNLCPKRFTRAYNLRSHLRTHTDERPFVCTVCNKAFARQHDRKRHEGLHSGEKKFVCKGELAQPGQTWGCGRRFARADALGRHFRSEAGRVCIKPLLDEEAAERQRQYEEQMMAQGGGGLQPMVQPMGMENGQFTLPAALLAQYPALQTVQWDQLPPSDDEGRASFDGSGGGGFYEDEDVNSGYVSGPGTAYAAAWA